jgi:hypothetical protein
VTPSGIGPLHFTRGRHAYIVAPARDGEGYVGYRDGRIVVRDAERAKVAHELIARRVA